MPVNYEFESLDCSTTIYCEHYPSSVRVIITVDSGISRFDSKVSKHIKTNVYAELDNAYELDVGDLDVNSFDEPTTQVYVVLHTIPDSLTDIGEVVGRGIKNAEREIVSNDGLDNADFNVGVANVLFED